MAASVSQIPASPRRRGSRGDDILEGHVGKDTLQAYEAKRVRTELCERGFCVIPQLLAPTAIARARKHLENETQKHLVAAVAAGKLEDACDGLPLEDRMAAAYASDPSAAPNSWVAQTKHSFAFQQLLFRDPALVELISAVTGGRSAEVASRFNCRCKLPGAPGAAFPWHQDHAFFRMQCKKSDHAAQHTTAAHTAAHTPQHTRRGAHTPRSTHAAEHRRLERTAHNSSSHPPPLRLRRLLLLLLSPQTCSRRRSRSGCLQRGRPSCASTATMEAWSSRPALTTTDT